jgi:hypothetical protein
VSESSVLWPAVADLCSTPALSKMTTNGRSSSKGVAFGRRFLQLQQCVASFMKIGVEIGLMLNIFR